MVNRYGHESSQVRMKWNVSVVHGILWYKCGVREW